MKLQLLNRHFLTIYVLFVFLCSWESANLPCAFAEVQPGTFRINLGTEPPTLDWIQATDATSFDVISNIMIGLTQYDNELHCEPACAKDWQILDAGKRYIFHIRPNVKWTDGKPVSAHDFEYAWKRLLNPNTASQYAFFLYDIENAFEYNTGKEKDQNKVGVKALDNSTLEIKLKRPAAYFLYLTAFGPTYPQRKDIVERFGNRWTDPKNIVTNGPFKIALWQHEYKIELVANPNYYAGKPRLSKIKMFMIPEPATAFALYESGELDYVDNRSLSTSDVERISHSREYRSFPLLRNTYIGFNFLKSPTNDVRIRQAISMSIDRNIFPATLRRHEIPIGCWIPVQLPGYAKSDEVAFNPNMARKLLSEAGYPNGKGFPVLQVLYPSREDVRLVMEAVQDQLKRNLNIHIELVNQEWKVFLETLRRDPPQLFRNSWGADYPDPQTFMNLFTTNNGNNNTHFASVAYDKLIDDASAEQNPSLRAQKYANADKMLCKDQAVIAPLYLSTQSIMVKPWVKNMKFNPLDLQFFKEVYIDSGATR